VLKRLHTDAKNGVWWMDFIRARVAKSESPYVIDRPLIFLHHMLEKKRKRKTNLDLIEFRKEPRNIIFFVKVN
jgi:hypothetical protein